MPHTQMKSQPTSNNQYLLTYDQFFSEFLFLEHNGAEGCPRPQEQAMVCIHCGYRESLTIATCSVH